MIGNIIKGHFNELIGKNTDLSLERLLICYRCPLFLNRLGGICNNKLWLNPNTGDVSTESKEGYVRGCSCKISYKVKHSNARCPAGKW